MLVDFDSIIWLTDYKGMFSPAHMEYFLESETANNPTLEEMTRKAIEMLQKEANGYVLLVEGNHLENKMIIMVDGYLFIWKVEELIKHITTEGQNWLWKRPTNLIWLLELHWI